MAAKKPKKPTAADWQRRARVAELRIPQLEAERDTAATIAKRMRANIDAPPYAELQNLIAELRDQCDEATGLAAEMTQRAEIAEERNLTLENAKASLLDRLQTTTYRMFRMQGYIDHARERARLENGFDPRPAAYPATSERNSQNPANEHRGPARAG